MKEAEMAKTPANYIDLDVVVRKEGSQYSSWCPDLDIASCGDSPDDALRNLGDAAELYLNTLEEEGEMGKVFTERGIRIVRIDEPVVPRSFVTQYRQKVGASV
jgi:predicted RNase H-like HicB family nuclease